VLSDNQAVKVTGRSCSR